MVSAIGFGAWAIGGDWGTVDDGTGLRALHAAADAGVTLFDTAESPPKSVRFSSMPLANPSVLTDLAEVMKVRQPGATSP